ncbi:MAG: hypothetical protein Kow0062_05160 [Acidobacteriota bacterium]
MNGDREEAAWLRQVERHFRELRNRPLLLSPADFRLAQSWFERGVPLWLVLQTITELFEQARRAGRPDPRSLRYCRDAVEHAFRAWQAAQAGAASASSRADGVSGDPIERARRALASSEAPEAVRRTILEALAAPPDDPGDVAWWRGLDRTLVDGCIAALPPDERVVLERRADAQLAPFAEAMSPEVLARARRAALERLVRERWHLPDLTLVPLV